MKTNLRLLVAGAAMAGLSLTSTSPALSHGCDSHASETKAEAVSAETKNIVDTAVAAGTFNTLVAAVTTAELVETLSGEGPFTVFAPTDEAFAKLPEGTVEKLLLPENRQKLVDILTYHVVAGAVMAKDVVSLDAATTVQGNDLAVLVDDSGVRVGSASVVATDIAASNGVIHVIDTVLLPPSDKAL